MNDLDQLLYDGLNDLADSAPHNRELGNTIVRRSRRRSMVTLAPIAAALAVLATGGTALLIRPGTVDPAIQPASACSPIRTGVLPTWARGGFTDPSPTSPFAISKDGQMVAIIFADPLRSPAKVGMPSNKILWVSKDATSANSTLRISGRIEGGTATMQATVAGGPGPSIIDVPSAGCWQFNLSWGTHRDVIDIAYEAD